MNQSEGFVFSNQEQSLEKGFVFSNQEQSIGNGNGTGFMSQHFMNNSNQLSFSQSGKNLNISGKSEAQIRTESLYKRIKLSPDFNLQLQDISTISKEPKPLCLKLSITPSFQSKLDKTCSSKENNPKQQNEGSSSSSRHEKRRAKTDDDKFKAANFPAIHLKIGTWQKLAMREGDLVVKLYYVKRKLVWEVLEGPLKSKFEIQWDDICAIRATTLENEPGILEIELIQPPVYYRETSPQPRRHTLWRQSSDFTGGQAPIWRRHHVTFPPGILDKNYEKLLECDKRLNDLSQKPFPFHGSPYFDPTLFGTTLNFGGYGANKAAQYPYRAYSATIPREPLFRATPNPSLPVMDLPIAYQGGGNYQFAAPNQASWNQSISIPTDNFGIHGTFGIPSTTNANNVHDPSAYDPNASGLLTDIEAEFLDNVQLDNSLLESLSSTSSQLEPTGFNNNNINDSSNQPNMAFHDITGDQGSNNNNYGFPDPINWLAAQYSSNDVFQSANENMFHCASENVFQGATENMFQGSSENMFQSSNENVFELANNNPGLGGFFNQNPF